MRRGTVRATVPLHPNDGHLHPRCGVRKWAAVLARPRTLPSDRPSRCNLKVLGRHKVAVETRDTAAGDARPTGLTSTQLADWLISGYNARWCPTMVLYAGVLVMESSSLTQEKKLLDARGVSKLGCDKGISRYAYETGEDGHAIARNRQQLVLWLPKKEAFLQRARGAEGSLVADVQAANAASLEAIRKHILCYLKPIDPVWFNSIHVSRERCQVTPHSYSNTKLRELMKLEKMSSSAQPQPTMLDFAKEFFAVIAGKVTHPLRLGVTLGFDEQSVSS
ncbi:hypothetical protein BKA63DRAFT_497495 [Paraphoma chrysanthemicola]|nr:hypothetical protein BKA63DRAFT_497495 [Paraphoma chrysanthemicola]